jgi:hypothetical protein
MRHRRTLLAVAAAALAASAAPALPPAASAAALPLFQVGSDAAIIRSFRSVLGRDPSARELLRYRTLTSYYGWSERDVRNDLANRADYRRYRNDTGTRPNQAIRSAYLDILGREPDREGLRNYRQRMVRDGWTEQDVRESLRESPEYASRRHASVDSIIRRAYLDVLRREPDPEGLAHYRRRVLEEGWEFHDVRTALRTSPERRQQIRTGRRAVSETDAQEMVRRAYRSVLGREVDAGGLASYTDKILRDGWSQADVERALRESDEYRNRR